MTNTEIQDAMDGLAKVGTGCCEVATAWRLLNRLQEQAREDVKRRRLYMLEQVESMAGWHGWQGHSLVEWLNDKVTLARAHQEQAKQPTTAAPEPANGPHTPGPWTVNCAEGLFIITDSPESHGSVAHLADRPTNEHDAGYDTPEVRANARLIAAAPDMLAALKKIANEVAWWDARDLAQAAIAKAEGKSLETLKPSPPFKVGDRVMHALHGEGIFHKTDRHKSYVAFANGIYISLPTSDFRIKAEVANV